MTDNSPLKAQEAYAQAKKYGEELARLYAIEKKRRREVETTTEKLQAIWQQIGQLLADTLFCLSKPKSVSAKS